MLEGTSKVVGAKVDRFEQDDQKALARTFVDFSKDLAIWKATRSKAFSCNLVKSAWFCYYTDEFRAIDPFRGNRLATNALELTHGIDLLSNSNIIALWSLVALNNLAAWACLSFTVDENSFFTISIRLQNFSIVALKLSCSTYIPNPISSPTNSSVSCYTH